MPPTVVTVLTGPEPVIVTGDVEVWYLAVCQACGPRNLPVPFSSRGERDTWSSEHTAGTEHDVLHTTEVRGK